MSKEQTESVHSDQAYHSCHQVEAVRLGQSVRDVDLKTVSLQGRTALDTSGNILVPGGILTLFSEMIGPGNVPFARVALQYGLVCAVGASI